MPWTLNDYPSSLKNLPHSAKKKAIDIANTLVDERKKYEERGEPKKNKTEYPSRPELLDTDELVVPQDNQWAVQPKTAKKADKLFSTKEEAIEHGKSIAKNKETQLHVYRKDNSIEDTFDYRIK